MQNAKLINKLIIIYIIRETSNNIRETKYCIRIIYIKNDASSNIYKCHHICYSILTFRTAHVMLNRNIISLRLIASFRCETRTAKYKT